ncbi:MAG: hypothetical protein V1739_09835 [Candidatus Omnitrophota bacterium]
MLFGLGVNVEKTIPKKLEDILNQKSEETRYEVINCGVPGYNLMQEIEFLKDKIVKFNPDMAIFYVIQNDLNVKITLDEQSTLPAPQKWLIRHWMTYRFYHILNVRKASKDKNPKRIEKVINETRTAISDLKKISSKGMKAVFVFENRQIFEFLEKDLQHENFYVFQLFDNPMYMNNCKNFKLAKYDGHYNIQGSLLIAKLISKFLFVNVLQ